MANSKTKNNDNKKMLIIAFVMIVLLFAIINSINDNNTTEKVSIDGDKVENSEEQMNSEIADEEKQKTIAKLKKMGERDRMEFYFSTFLSYLEDGNYEEAYALLNEEYKANYFPNIENFKEYANQKFSDMVSVKHKNFERIGDMYILVIQIADAINDSPKDENEMNVVIKENDFFDFEMSFSVI